MTTKQRTKIANYLNIAKGGTSPTYALMGTGFKELNESPSAQVTSKRYINDKSASKSITGYDWSSAFTADVIADDDVLKYIIDIGEKQLIGSDAESDYVIVDLDKKSAEPAKTNEYSARKLKVAIEVASFGCEDGEVTLEGNLQGIGDPVEGYFDISTKTFTASV